MKQYFIVVDNQQTGPYTLEELRSMELKPDTLVWYADMENWTQASALPEFEDLFITKREADIAEQQPPATPADAIEVCPKQNLGLAIFSAVMFPIGIAAIVKTVLIKTRWDQGRYDDARWLAKSARKFSIISIVIGFIFLALFLAYYISIIILIAYSASH